MRTGWRTVALGDVASFLSGGTPSRSKPEYWQGELPWITGADVAETGEIEARSYVSELGVANSATTVVPAGTILLVTRTSVGKIGVAPVDLAFSQDLTAIAPYGELDATYLRAFLRSMANRLARQARGATIKGVTRQVVEGLRLPLPPLDEQRRIAAVLDHVDALRARRREALSDLATYPDSVFRSMFVRGAPVSWRRAIVEDLLADGKDAIRTGPFGSQLLKEEFTESGVPVLGIDNVVTNTFRWAGRRYISETKYGQLKRYTVWPGDVLITIMGTNGRVAIVPEGIPAAINTKHLCCITIDKERCLPEYLRATFLWHPESRRYLGATAKGAIMAGLNMGIIRNLPVTIPPMELQREFAAKVAKIEVTRIRAERHLAELDTLFASLQSRAFAGELDVSKVVLPN